ncbi:hypothetical protein C6P46_002022 [Rhodotorula mucilaginosa]|uniref:Uncharacterized protein n=1 Tax=Rhodotorula mucilaginosa TaxID=5537 RepID=A0A9P6VT08_RHOMI|nr:hypothetical protein C6P46_002022 [Rhodotorula mucilaginosa]
MTLGAADPNNPKVLDPNSRIAPVLDADHSDIVEPHAFAVWTFAAAAWRVTSLLVSWQRGGGGKALTTLAVPLLAFPRLVTFVFGTFLAEVRKPDPLAAATAGVGAGTADAANVAATTARVVRALNPLEKVLATFAGMVCLAMAAMLVIQTGAIPLTTKAVTPDAAVAPYRKPTLWIAVAFFASLATSSYSLALYSIAVPSAAISAWGFWVVFFAHLGHINQVSSKTASFPFKNVAAEEEKQELRNKRE